MDYFIEQVKKWIKDNRLLQIDIVIKKIGRKSIFGRIVHFNSMENSLLVYDDDHKQIEHIMMSEIDNILPASSHWIVDHPQ